MKQMSQSEAAFKKIISAKKYIKPWVFDQKKKKKVLIVSLFHSIFTVQTEHLQYKPQNLKPMYSAH